MQASAQQHPSSDYLRTADVPYAQTPDDVVAALCSDAVRGLTAAQVEQLTHQYGPNCIPESPGRPRWREALEQFEEPVVWLLLAAAGIAAAMREWVEVWAVCAIVILNAALGFFQKLKSDNALAALRQMSSPSAKVTREAILATVPTSQLVPGDLVLLEAGDLVPADVRLISGFGLRIVEAALTGESLPAQKDPQTVHLPHTGLGDRSNMAYLGTTIAAGKATAIVVATGLQTELGRIAGMLERTTLEITPLQRQLARLGSQLVVICLGLVSIIAALQLARGAELLDTLRLAVSLAVAAVPEGLPAVVTITLALGVQRMVGRNALIRRLSSVETLGSVTTICTDKTGTLTRNEMTVRDLYVGGKRYDVSGSGYEPIGTICLRDDPSAVVAHEADGLGHSSDVRKLLEVATWCNHAQLLTSNDRSDRIIIGDPTEAALIVAAEKAGIKAHLPGYTIVSEKPFDSDRKAMSMVVRSPDGRRTLFLKGAPEVVLSNSRFLLENGDCQLLTDLSIDEAHGVSAEMAGRALRVLAFGYRELSSDPEESDVERDLVFVGLAGMIDPPREAAKDAVLRCREAGIRPVMITGDHPITARAIAQELGMIAENNRLMTGAELEAMDDHELVEAVQDVCVYARVTAEHKLRIVRALKKDGGIVAMTGDGVNDAPAIKAADIGIAMGITGTDVTKGASAMVLMDDNFASIVNAVEEGRGIYDNIHKFVCYLLAGNAGKLLVMFFAVCFALPTPLLPVQILWLNLVTDGLAALALGLEPTEPGVMRRRPRDPSQRLLGRLDLRRIFTHGLIAALAALTAFLITWQGNDENISRAQAVVFCVLGLSQLLYAFTCRSRTLTAFSLGLSTNAALVYAACLSAALQLIVVIVAPLREIFGIHAAPTAEEWAVIIVFSILPAAIIELWKVVAGNLHRAKLTAGR